MKFFSSFFLIFFASVLIAQDVQLIVPAGHSRRITDIQLSPDQRYLASADGSNRIIIWDYQTGQELYHITASHSVSAIAYHGKSLVIGISNGHVMYYGREGQLLEQISIGKNSVSQIISNGNDLYLTVSDQIFLIDSANTQTSLKLPDEASCLWVNDQQAYVGTKGGQLIVVDLPLANVEKKLSLSERRIGTITQKGNYLHIGDDDGAIHQMDLTSYETQNREAFSLRNYKLATHPSIDWILGLGRDEKQNIQGFKADLSAYPVPFELPLDHEDLKYRLGLRVALFSTDSTFLVGDYDQVIREFDLKNNRWVDRKFKGNAASINDLSVSPDENMLAIASDHAEVKILDLTGRKKMVTIPSQNGGSKAIDFHPVNPVVAVYGENEKLAVYHTLTQEKILEFKAKGDYSTTPVTFDPSGNYLLRKSSESDFDFYNFRRKSPKNLKVKDGIRYQFSRDGRSLIFQTKTGLSLYDPLSLKLVKEIDLPNVQDIALSKNDQLAVLLKDDKTIGFYDVRLTKTDEIKLDVGFETDRITWGPNEAYLLGYRNSVSKGAQPDFHLRWIPLQGNPQKHTAHNGFINSIAIVNEKLLSSSIDGTIKIWDFKQNKPMIGQLIPLDSSQLVVSTPSGLFDVTPAAMNNLHYVKAGKIIALEQMKSAYYEPHLLSKLLGLNDEPIRESASLTDIGLHPELIVKHPAQNDGKLGINLVDNGGGIGRVVILINGKEVSSDMRDIQDIQNGNMRIDYDLAGHPFLYGDRVNKVSIKAYNEDGTLSTDAQELYVFGEESTVEKPQLFAIIAGSSDYASDRLDLKFAAKDAHDFANAIKLSSEAYLGKDHAHVTLLSTDMSKDQWPTKKNIRRAFEKYSREASANDLLVVYISGHGVNKSGEQSDFYYLTCAAENGDLEEAAVRSQVAISSAEFTEWIKSVPALKQILVIDACHSGRLAASLRESRAAGAVSSTQVRALERMKDRTGLYVLAGSAADAVSYETSLFGQGLLTYSLLFGMKGAALRNDEFIDVIQLFQFAANMVPDLAKDIGGIQQPQVRMPVNAQSFDIGLVTEDSRDKIKIAEPKPVFVHARFQDESTVFDRLNISDLLDQKLLEISHQQEAPIIFLDKKDFSNAITIHGRYSTEADLITAKVTLTKNDELVRTFDVSAVNESLLTDEIIQEVMSSDH